MMDYLQQIRENIGGKIIAQEYSNANVQGVSHRQLALSNLNGFRIRVDDFETMCSVGIKVNSVFAFSINRPDPTFAYIIPVRKNGFPYEIYISKYKPNFSIGDLDRFFSVMAEFLIELRLQAEEGFFIYSNLVSFVLRTDRDITRILRESTCILTLDPTIFSTSKKEISFSNKDIPDILKPLSPLLKEWAISDDSEREVARNNMTHAEKRELIDIVWPLMSEINKYLDSFERRPVPEAATLIGSLAELVSELKVG